jgi:hypothetical protein
MMVDPSSTKDAASAGHPVGDEISPIPSQHGEIPD